MAIRTASSTGNLSALSGFTNDDQIVVSNGVTLTVDIDATVGTSPPSRPTVLATLSSVAGGGSLGAATYIVAYTNVDSGGQESAISPGSIAQAITSGNTLRVTLPARPTGVSSRNVYITTGSAGSEKLYKTGATGTTVDCTSASWTDGTTTEAAAAAVPNKYAFTIGTSGELKVNTGKVLKVRGDVTRGSTVTLDGTAVWEWDASAAASPSNTKYGDFAGTATSGQFGIKLRTTNTSSGARATIRSNSGGGNGFFRNGIGPGFVGEYLGTANFDLHYCDVQRVGDGTNDAARVAPGSESNVQTFELCTFDANSGSVAWANAPGASAGYDIDNCEFNQTACRTIGGAAGPTPLHVGGSSTTPTGTRRVRLNYFNQRPTGRGFGTTWQTNFFDDRWTGPSDSTPWAEFSGNFLRKTTNEDQPTNGSISALSCVYDPPKTVLTSGTASGGSSTTLTVSGTPWTSGQYASSGGDNACKTVRIVTGTGAGQRRRIYSNTTNALTVKPNWVTAPDATSTYEILSDGGNFHALGAAQAGQTTCGLTDSVFGSTSCDGDGDLWKSFGQANCTYTASGNIVLPNASRRDSTAAFVTMFNNTPSTVRLRVRHNTLCVGLQSGIQITEGGSNQPAGTLEDVLSNIFHAIGAASEYAGGLEVCKILDSQNTTNPALNTQDILTAGGARKNWGFNLRSGAFAGNSYQTNCSVAPGTTDGSGDPQFVDLLANWDTWDASLGGPGTFDSAFARMRANRSLIATAYTWIRDRWKVQNPTCENFGDDGVTVGAMPYQAAVSVGIAAVTLGAVTSAGAGVALVVGGSGVTLAGVTAAGVGVALARGSAGVTLAPLASAGAGVAPVVGGSGVTLAGVSLSAAGVGTQTSTGTAAVTLASLSLAGAGAVAARGSAAVTLVDLTAAGLGVVAVAGGAGVTLADLTAAGAGAASGDGPDVDTVGGRWLASSGAGGRLVGNDLAKAAGDVVRLAMDFGDLPELLAGADVLSCGVGPAGPPGSLALTGGRVEAGGYAASVVVSGGTAGQDYLVPFAATLTTGATLTRSGVLRVL